MNLAILKPVFPFAAAAMIGGSAAFLVGLARQPQGVSLESPAVDGKGKVLSSRGGNRPMSDPQTRELFQKAWARLMSRDMAIDVKHEAGSLLLKKWAAVDPEGALAAALEADHQALAGTPTYLHALDDAMLENREWFLALISSSSLGLDRALVRNEWISVMAKNCPDFLVAHLDDLPGKSRTDAVQCMVETLGKDGDPASRDALLASLATLPDTSENRVMWEKAGEALANLGAAALKDRILSATTPGEKAMAVKGFGMAMILVSRDESKAALDALPASLRSEIVAKAIQYDGGTTGALMSTLDVLLDSDRWDAASKRAMIRIHNLGLKAQDPIEMANWAVDLPERPNTEEVFQTALRAYFYRSPADAKEWIQSIPSGWKRDNAYVEYSRDRLVRGSDREGAEWAVSQIQDPRLRETAIKAKTYWEGQQGR